jgi:hypothetical protein
MYIDCVLASSRIAQADSSRRTLLRCGSVTNASANMFYLLKHLLLLILIIFKLKCNNLIFNEIVILNALYVCVVFSLH